MVDSTSFGKTGAKAHDLRAARFMLCRQLSLQCVSQFVNTAEDLVITKSRQMGLSLPRKGARESFL